MLRHKAGWPLWTVLAALIALGATHAAAEVRLLSSNCSWWVNERGNLTLTLEFDNPGETSAGGGTGAVYPQSFGICLARGVSIPFLVPTIEPHSSQLVYWSDLLLADLPPTAQQTGEPPPGSCPDDNSWDGNMDVVWDSPDGSGVVSKSAGEFYACIGGACSSIHVVTDCSMPATWTLGSVEPGFTVTLLNENESPAPNPVAPGWTGWICVSADAGLAPGTNCRTTINFVSSDQPATIDLSVTACACAPLDVGPDATGVAFSIDGVVPNPTTGRTTVQFSLPLALQAQLEIFDATGKRVRTLLEGVVRAGQQTATWDGRDAGGMLARPGTYFVRLSAGGNTRSCKLVLRP